LVEASPEAVSVDKRERERAGAPEVHRADGDPALVVDKLRHLRAKRASEEDRRESEAEGGKFHGVCWVRRALVKGNVRSISHAMRVVETPQIFFGCIATLRNLRRAGPD